MADIPDLKPRSRDVTDGLERAAARGMLRAVGMGDEDFAKPQIGVASSWNEITPCNLSLDRLAKAVGDRALVGAGTVLDTLSVARVKDAGGRLIVAPNTNAQVISAAVQAEMVAAPGYFTPTEAFVALDAGAQALKLFPAEAASPGVLRAQLAVIPGTIPVLAVGGITPENMAAYLAAGARGFGLGSGLYSPGRRAADVGKRARDYVAALSR